MIVIIIMLIVTMIILMAFVMVRDAYITKELQDTHEKIDRMTERLDAWVEIVGGMIRDDGK